MTQDVGTPALVMAAWVAAGLLSLAGALTFAELGAMFPEAGGEYVYLKKSYGETAAFLFGWQRFIVAGSASIASLGSGFAIFLAAFLPLNAVWVRREVSLLGQTIDWQFGTNNDHTRTVVGQTSESLANFGYPTCRVPNSATFPNVVSRPVERWRTISVAPRAPSISSGGGVSPAGFFSGSGGYLRMARYDPLALNANDSMSSTIVFSPRCSSKMPAFLWTLPRSRTESHLSR